jgi:hypothetical protein
MNLFDRAVRRYQTARTQYLKTKSPSAIKEWQSTLLEVLKTYDGYVHLLKKRRIQLPENVVTDLAYSLQLTVDGKNSPLFHVDPSDKYDSFVRGSIEAAVRYVSLAKNNNDKRNRKQRIMDVYGISRSLLNQWIRDYDPRPLEIDEAVIESELEVFSQIYRASKLVGRRKRVVS